MSAGTSVVLDGGGLRLKYVRVPLSRFYWLVFSLRPGSPEGDMAVSCALEGPGMGLAAPHCHPAPPEAQGNSWGCLGPAVAMLVAIQRPKRAKSVPRQKGPKPCKSTLGGSRGMKPPQPMAQITQRDPWGVCELHRTTGGTSNKPTTLLAYCSRANHQASRGPFLASTSSFLRDSATKSQTATGDVG